MGVRDKEDLKKQKSKDVPLLMEELKLKYRGITIHKNIKCNTWYTRFRSNGKQQYISAKTQQECYNKLKKALKQTETIQKTNFNKITFIDWYNKWLELYKIGKVKDDTLRDYKTVLNYIPAEIQNKEMSAIVLSEIIEVLNNCQKERQKQKLYDFLNMLFKKALDNEIIEKNLLTKIDKPKHEKNHGQALTNEQQLTLIETCNKIDNADVMLVAMYQGLRRGEVLGLTIDCIDFENERLSINKAINQHNQYDTTKNKQSIRTMPLFKEAKDILIKYANCQQRIFNLSTKQLELLLKKIKEESKIENLKMKDMRSTFITRCKELNIPTHIIQAWVGHKLGSSVTNTVYTKYNSDADFKYINILNNSKFYSNSTQIKK